MKRALVVLSVGLFALSCGGSDEPKSPTGPTGSTVANLAGVWSYAATLSSVTGGDCVGPLYRIGALDTGSMSITQTGANLTATTRSNADGSSCVYTGTAGSGSAAFGWQACDVANITNITCTNGQHRDIKMITNVINATVAGNVGTGTQVQTFNVTVTGTGAGAGIMTMSSAFRATK